MTEHIHRIHERIEPSNTNSEIVAQKTKGITDITGNITQAITEVVTAADGQNQKIQSISKSMHDLDNQIQALTEITKSAGDNKAE